MILKVIKECWTHRKQMLAMAKVQFKLQYNQTNLNIFWAIINPAVQAFTYWLVFNIGMKVSSPIDGMPYVAWMLTGLIPWIYISSVLVSSAGSIVASRGIVVNMKYPLSTIPVAAVCTELLSHLAGISILIIVQLFLGVRYGYNLFYLFYFVFCAWIFLASYAILASALTVVVRDVQKVMQAVIRMLFFLMPITWIAPENSVLGFIMRWNPLSYIINGYRESMLSQVGFNIPFGQHILFWGSVIVLIVIGCVVHSILRPKFADYL